MNKRIYCLPFMLLSACAVGPDYVRPSVETPAAFKENWKPATPNEISISEKWWENFNDPVLNSLHETMQTSNQNLRIAEATYRQAMATLSSSQASFFPNLNLNANEARSRTAALPVTQSESLGATTSWELDLWGRVRRSVENADDRSQASRADLAATRLSTHATLTTTYFQIRTSDIQYQLLTSAVKGYTRTQELTNNRYQAGVATKADVVQAQTQLQSTQAQALDNRAQRAVFEHALAVLLGKAPAAFSLEPIAIAKLTPPAAPTVLPSQLLERRPDIAAAERRMAAANAQIGVTQAAFFPTISLSGSASYRGSVLRDLLELPNRAWSIGPTLALSLFDAGARSAQKASAIAAYDQAVASYKQAVLVAFQEVEDNLSNANILEQEAKFQDDAVKYAQETLTITENQYRAGTVSYSNVVTAQNALLTAERSAADLSNRRISAAMQLLKNAGGRWDTTTIENQRGE